MRNVQKVRFALRCLISPTGDIPGQPTEPAISPDAVEQGGCSNGGCWRVPIGHDHLDVEVGCNFAESDRQMTEIGPDSRGREGKEATIDRDSHTESPLPFTLISALRAIRCLPSPAVRSIAMLPPRS